MYSVGVGRRIVRRMDEYELVDSFNCGDNFGELNSFIVDDADLYRRELLAVTYLMEDAGIPIAYFSLANDRIGIEDFENSTLYNRFRRKTFVNSKRIKHYPAVKICRLGVSEKLQHLGIGTAIILKVEASTGGSDLISHVAKEYNPTIKMGRLIIIIDFVIVLLNVIFLGQIEIGLYSAIVIYLMGQIIDVLFEGIYFTKLLLIISDKSEEIAKVIGEKIQRGATGLYGKGMYTNEEKLVLMCASSRRDIAKIKMAAKKIDPKCFLIITNSREVVGLGFKKI